MARYPLILPGTENSLRRLLRDAAQRHGVSLHVPLQVRSQSLVNELVEQSLGFTILPYMAARLKIEEGKFVARRIVDPVVSTELRLIYKERRPALQGGERGKEPDLRTGQRGHRSVDRRRR